MGHISTNAWPIGMQNDGRWSDIVSCWIVFFFACYSCLRTRGSRLDSPFFRTKSTRRPKTLQFHRWGCMGMVWPAVKAHLNIWKNTSKPPHSMNFCNMRCYVRDNPATKIQLKTRAMSFEAGLVYFRVAGKLCPLHCRVGEPTYNLTKSSKSSVNQ